MTSDVHLNQFSIFWLHLPITVSFLVVSVFYKKVHIMHISLNSVRDNEFFSAHAPLIQISLFFSILWRQSKRSQRKITQGLRADCAIQWKRYYNQSMAGNADKLLIGGLKEKEKTEERKPKEMISVYHKSCHHHWELLICSNCHGWLHFETFVCHQMKWNAFGFLVIPNICGNMIYLFFSLSVLLT